jgi:benzylsuccinate CoA-transferase BbsF subunit
MSRPPLEGIRITDFSWIGAGSYATKVLADLGADVVKIESRKAIDQLRTGGPFKDKVKGVNRSGYFADRNTSKRSMTLDMKHPRALDIVKKLLATTDIIANNFTPGVMDRFGLGYDAVRAIKPDIIYLSMSMHGAEGPESGYLGYGGSIAALTGLSALTGMPGRPPAGTGTNYPDHIPNPSHAAFAVLAALRHRRRTGKGQRIDLAQVEPMIALLGPTLLDYTVNRHNQECTGNRHAWAAPHGVYRCKGDDRWIAIAVMNDDEWIALVEALGSPGWSGDARWSNLAARRQDAGALDKLIDGETATWEAEKLMAALQAKGVSAGVVQNAEDVVARDPQLAHRGHWIKLRHAEMGETIYNAPPFRFSRTLAGLRAAAPLLGEHTREICRHLGYSDSEIDALAADGVLT